MAGATAGGHAVAAGAGGGGVAGAVSRGPTDEIGTAPTVTLMLGPLGRPSELVLEGRMVHGDGAMPVAGGTYEPGIRSAGSAGGSGATGGGGMAGAAGRAN